MNKNFVRWDSGSSMPGGPGSALSQEKAESNWVSNCETLYDWFTKRIAFLNEEWNVTK